MTARGLNIRTPTKATAGRIRLIAAILFTNALFVLFIMDRWTFNNDPLHVLDFGYDMGGEDTDIRHFYEASVQNCLENATSNDSHFCAGYQKVILSNLFLNYPIANLFGALLQYHYGTESFLSQVADAVIRTIVAGFVLAWLFAIPALWEMPRGALEGGAVIFIGGGLLQRLMGDSAFPLDAPLGARPAVGAALMVMAVAATAFLAHRLRAIDPVDSAFACRYVRPLRSRAAIWWVAAALPLLAAGRASGVGAGVFQIAAAAAFVMLYVAAAVEARLPALPGLAVGIILVGLVNEAYGVALQLSRMQGFLVTGVLLAYATLKPRGRLVWLLPSTWLFHVSAAGLTALVVFVAEAILCLRRRRVSHLLGASLLTTVPAIVFVTANPSDPVSSLDPAALWSIADRLVSASAPLAGAGISLALLLSLAAALLARRDEEWDAAARFALLLCAAVAAAFIRTAVGADRAYEPGYYLFVMAGDYFAPAIGLGGVLGLTGLLIVRTLGRPWPAGESADDGSRRRWLLPATAVLCLIVAKAPPLTISKDPEGLLNGPAMVFLGRMPTDWPRLAIAGGDDDNYYVNAAKPKNDPIVYFSLLKMKVRKAVGRFDASQMRVYAIGQGEPKLLMGPP